VGSWKQIFLAVLDILQKVLDSYRDYVIGQKYKDAQDDLSGKDTAVDDAINDVLQNTCTCFKQFGEADTTCRVHKRSFICTKLDKRSIEYYKPVRIQIGDGKEAMIYPIIPDWHSVYVSTPITGKSRCYIRVPSFFFSDIDEGRDSYIRLQYNYTADKDFILGSIGKIINSNVVLCIRYRIGDNIYRWKLWEDDLFTQNIPLYNGELIKKNFVIEVWTLKGVKEIGIGSDLLLNTTIRRDSVSISDYKYENNNISTITVFDNIQQGLINNADIGTLLHNWDPNNAVISDGKVLSIKDELGSTNDLITTDTVDGFTLIKGDNLFNGSTYINPQGNGTVRSLDNITGSFDNYYNVIGFLATCNSRFRVSFHNAILSYDNGEYPVIQVAWRGCDTLKEIPQELDDTKPFLILVGATKGSAGYLAEAILYQNDSFSYINNGVFDNNSPIDKNTPLGRTTPYIHFQCGLEYAITNLCSVVAYKANNYKLQDLASGMLGRYYGNMTLPLQFNEGIAWLDNEK